MLISTNFTGLHLIAGSSSAGSDDVYGLTGPFCLSSFDVGNFETSVHRSSELFKAFQFVLLASLSNWIRKLKDFMIAAVSPGFNCCQFLIFYLYAVRIL